MEDLIFSSHWNNKLSCDYFSTIRLHNANRFKVGNYFKIFVKEKSGLRHIAPARVVSIAHYKAIDLPEHACYLDTGYGKEETINIIKNMYKNMQGFSIEQSVFDLVVLKKIKQL